MTGELGGESAQICKFQGKVCTQNGILKGDEGFKIKSLHKQY